jgi:protein ImuA
MRATSIISSLTNAAPQGEYLASLRQTIARIEGGRIPCNDAAACIPFGLPDLDEMLGGGLARAALHEVAAVSEAEIAAATGFALALASRSPRAVLWIAEDMTKLESGAPYGPGLDEIGLAPEKVLTVAAAHARDVLWVMEEALQCSAVGFVIGEIRQDNAVQDVASRRLSLAAARQQTPALLLRARPEPRPVSAATRWIIGTAPSMSRDGWRYGTGPPAFSVQLVRNRYGRLGSWVLEWNCAEQRFDLASTHPQPVAAPALYGSHSAAVA